jgi:hypothetical protein
MTDLITALAAKLMELVVGKIFDLKRDKFVVSLQIRNFSFGKVNNKPAVLALIALNNRTEKPFSISEMYLIINDIKIKNRYIKKVERKFSSKELLSVTTGLEEPGLFNVSDDFDFTEVMHTPYLLPFETKQGLVLFEFPENLNGNEITLAAEVGGFGVLASERLI